MALPFIGEPETYLYSKATDFSGGLAIECLDSETRAALPGILNGVFIEEGDDRVVINFTRVLTGGEETTLDGVVASHDPFCEIPGTETETNIVAPKDGDVLAWDSTAGAWVNTTPEVKIDTPSSLWASLNLDLIEDDTLSSTTSTTFQNKISITMPGIPGGGVYRLGYSMEFNSQNNNKSVEVRVYNSTDGLEIAENLQQTNNSGNYFSFAGIHHQTMGATSKTFVLQYRAIGTTCNVRNAVLEIWRIS